MTATIQKWGNNLGRGIPPAVAKQIHVKEGSSGLTVKAAPKKISLDDLLSQVTPENLHPATEWGADVGREVRRRAGGKS